ncbi:lanthionine synthetase C family protein [Streptomyces sp. NPDC018321]|uniref:lanthionine synthetase C family protein n=1 Tax=unclassified Streptomyces TaxID=2593676 RepID=UPI00379B1735
MMPVRSREEEAPPPRDAARETAYRVARLLRDPERVARVTSETFRAAPDELMLPGWQPASLLLGHAGIALLHTLLARHDGAWAPVAHAHLSAAAAAVPEAGAAAAGDLLLPARLQAARFGGYKRLLTRGTEVHAARAQGSVQRLRARLDQNGPGLSYLDYDVIAGLTRQGRSLLPDVAGPGDGRSAEALEAVLRFLAGLARPVRVRGSEVPGWWCDPARYTVPRDRAEFPEGDFNVGVAHGISGPLALLALADRAGYRVPGGREAVRRMTEWVLAKERTDAWGPYWPGRVAFEEETGEGLVGPGTEESRTARADGSARTARAGWCYGVTGIAWSLHLAGTALGDEAVTSRALAAMRGALRRPLPRATAADAGVCHGRAGMVHAGARLAAATGDDALWADVDEGVTALVAAFTGDSAFGYRQHLWTPDGAVELDSPSLLDGAAGVALVLASYADTRREEAADADGPRTAGWDAALAMS